MRSDLYDRLHGKLIVSCQASVESPLAAKEHILALARSAEIGGATGLRLEGIQNVAYVRAVLELPIIGIIKHSLPPDHAFITLSSSEVEALSVAGADIIAFDATDRLRDEPIAALVAACHRQGRLAMADISTHVEAQRAMDAGADFVGTTLSGYTPGSTRMDGPDCELMRNLSDLAIPFVAEGRIWTPDQAVAALATGAIFTVVGTAITRPDHITARFVDALSSHRKRSGPDIDL